MEPEQILAELLRETGASRATLRQRSVGGTDAGYPIRDEVTATEAESIRDVRAPNMAQQPVVLRVLSGEQVVQDDCNAVFPDDEHFHSMLVLYGGMRAQIVTPIVRNGETIAILSLHELKRTRSWSAEEIARCRDAAEAIGAVIDRETS